jgi:hypothetical protein
MLKNVAAVEAAVATLLDLVDMLPEEKGNLPYHFFGNNYFSSMKLMEEMTARNFLFISTIHKDRSKGNPPYCGEVKKEIEEPP